MNKKERNEAIKLNWYKYHIPSMSNLHRIKRNAIFINRKNSKEHEHPKIDLAYESQFYITEAERSSKNEEEIKLFNLKTAKKRVDFVDLITGSETEIVHKHESDIQIQFYRKTGVFVMIVGNKITCQVCGLVYPRRNKKSICQICKAEGKKL